VGWRVFEKKIRAMSISATLRRRAFEGRTNTGPPNINSKKKREREREKVPCNTSF
jgi:hypothetical protein